MNSLPGNDHAAVSKFRTEGVHEWQSVDGQTDATGIAAALDANTEATLAVAHEQRTANLIALYSCDDWQNKMTISKWDQVAQQIEARLGLNGDMK